MPTYEYRCPKGHQFELRQRMSDDPVAVCPECGEPSQRMLSGGAGVLFKGEGFYVTDYRSDDYRKKAKAELGSAGSGQTKPTSGSGGASSGGEGGGGEKSAKATEPAKTEKPKKGAED